MKWLLFPREGAISGSEKALASILSAKFAVAILCFLWEHIEKMLMPSVFYTVLGNVNSCSVQISLGYIGCIACDFQYEFQDVFSQLFVPVNDTRSILGC